MRTPFPALLVAIAVSSASLANAQDSAEPYLALSTYDFGGSRDALNTIQASIRSVSNDATRLAFIEGELCAVLGRKGVPAGAKDFICGQLAVIGTERCVPAVAKLLGDERDADQARRVLERLPGPAASRALREAVATTTGRARIGVINSLGERREASAVPVLAGLLNDADAATAEAVARALGRIGSSDALRTLVEKADLAKPGVADALLLAADANAGSASARAAAAYEKVFRGASLTAARMAAFGGWAKLSPDKAREPLLELLNDAKPENQALAIQLARTVHTPGLGKALAARLTSLDAKLQAALLPALADMGDPAAVPPVLQLAASTNAEVAAAAIDALGRLPGDRNSVQTLADLAAKGSRDAARSLVSVRGDEVDNVLIRLVSEGETAGRVVVLKAVAERQTAAARKPLLKLREAGDAELRREALKALEKIGTDKDYAALVAWMTGATDEREQQAAERAVLKVAAHVAEPVAELAAADAKAATSGRSALARCAARLGGEKALALVRGHAASGDADLVLGAVRAMGQWPDAAPLGDLTALAGQTSADSKVRSLAVRGVLQLLEADRVKSADEKAAVCGQLLTVTTDAGDRKQIVNALTVHAGSKAMAVAASLVDDTTCGAEAKAVVARLKEMASTPKLTASHNNEEVGKATDHDPATRWTSNAGMSPGMWLQIDLQVSKTVKSVVLDASPSPNDYPRGYEVYIGDDPAKLGEPVLKGEGSKPVTGFTISPPRAGRYVKIVQTGRADQWYWSVHELTIDAELGTTGAP